MEKSDLSGDMLILKSEQSLLLFVDVSKIAGLVAKSVDPNRTLHMVRVYTVFTGLLEKSVVNYCCKMIWKYMSRGSTFPTSLHIRPASTKFSLRILTG